MGPGGLLDDDDCLDLLWRQRLSADGDRAWCPTCHDERRFRRLGQRPSYRCRTCSHDLHPTAGTIFHGSSTPLRTWFRAVDLLSGNNGAVTAKQLERELGVNYKTALRMSNLIRAQLAATGSEVAEIPGLVRQRAHQGIQAERHTVWAPGDISSFAGDGTPGYGGDGGPATAAQLSAPFGVAVDHQGNVLIADSGNHVIRKVDATGDISTVAGTGRAGYAGDLGPAVLAELNDPQHVAVDDNGALFIADCANHVVRMVDPSGVISTVAGAGSAGFSGDGGPAVNARFRGPSQTLPLGQELLISDYGNGRIRRIDGSGMIGTIAGNGVQASYGDFGPATEAALYRPCGLAVDADGNIYVAQLGELGEARVRRIDAAGTISTFAGGFGGGVSGDGGLAASAWLRKPVDVIVESSGTVLIAELNNHVIRSVDRSGTIRTVAGTAQAGFAGNGAPAGFARLNRPTGLALNPSGDLFIADSANHRVRVVAGPGAGDRDSRR